MRTRFGTTGKFEVREGVRQGCCLIISLALFLVAIGWLAQMLNNLFGENLWHLEYADDMILASHDLDILQKALDNLAEEGKRLGLVIHPGKTQAMACGRRPHSITFPSMLWCTGQMGEAYGVPRSGPDSPQFSTR